jgi:hypothetical protein
MALKRPAKPAITSTENTSSPAVPAMAAAYGGSSGTLYSDSNNETV